MILCELHVWNVYYFTTIFGDLFKRKKTHKKDHENERILYIHDENGQKKSV